MSQAVDTHRRDPTDVTITIMAKKFNDKYGRILKIHTTAKWACLGRSGVGLH